MFVDSSNLEGVASDGHASGEFALEADRQTGFFGYARHQHLIARLKRGQARDGRVVEGV